MKGAGLAAVSQVRITGAFADVESAGAATIRAGGSAAPGPASAVRQEVYPLYGSLYPALHPGFAMARVEG